jgi:hypothetical protein
MRLKNQKARLAGLLLEYNLGVFCPLTGELPKKADE